MQAPISPREAQLCNDLVTLAGLPAGLTSAYEGHFSSNRKVIAVYRHLLFEIGDIRYFDAPEGDIRDGSFVVPRRRMRWSQRFLAMPPGLPLDEQVVDFLIADGFNDGLPIGFVPRSAEHSRQLLSMGPSVPNEFCKAIDYKGRGEVRIYDVLNRVSGEFEMLAHLTQADFPIGR